MKRVNLGTFLKLFQNLTSRFSEEEIRNSSYLPVVQINPHNQNHDYTQITILGTVFEKGHAKNISVKLFKNLLAISEKKNFFLHFHIVQVAPFITAMFLEVSKFREEIFKRVIQGTYL